MSSAPNRFDSHAATGQQSAIEPERYEFFAPPAHHFHLARRDSRARLGRSAAVAALTAISIAILFRVGEQAIALRFPALTSDVSRIRRRFPAFCPSDVPIRALRRLISRSTGFDSSVLRSPCATFRPGKISITLARWIT